MPYSSWYKVLPEISWRAKRVHNTASIGGELTEKSHSLPALATRLPGEAAEGRALEVEYRYRHQSQRSS